MSPRASSGAADDADAASLCSSSCVHADGAANTRQDMRDETEVEVEFDASGADVEYDQAVGPVGDVGEARRRSRGGGCGGVSPSYGFGRGLPSSVPGAMLRMSCDVSCRPGLSEK